MNLRSLSTQELEHIIDEYPWFTLARKVYIQKLSLGQRDKILSFVKESSFHLLSRIDFIRAAEGLIGSNFAKEIEDKPRATSKQATSQRQYIIGGDYFGKEDFQQLSSEGLSVDINFSFNPDDGLDTMPVADNSEDSSSDSPSSEAFITETLAKIYADQELYPQAIEIYKQLILLYPEKNAYFASLIENIENIKNKIN